MEFKANLVHLFLLKKLFIISCDPSHLDSMIDCDWLILHYDVIYNYHSFHVCGLNDVITQMNFHLQDFDFCFIKYQMLKVPANLA